MTAHSREGRGESRPEALIESGVFTAPTETEITTAIRLCSTMLPPLPLSCRGMASNQRPSLSQLPCLVFAGGVRPWWRDPCGRVEGGWRGSLPRGGGLRYRSRSVPDRPPTWNPSKSLIPSNRDPIRAVTRSRPGPSAAAESRAVHKPHRPLSL
ncbi:hypothetical protein JZ751_018357 [Albula glossodonta]|uniref:Uncharacterized protein n=1 Tax=Albula glossodonta TaxID=121402 RepID=A0A8T2NP71_9TELE|nr:hypothetical protein JZ751_018357 [Albula glossodonta]